LVLNYCAFTVTILLPNTDNELSATMACSGKFRLIRDILNLADDGSWVNTQEQPIPRGVLGSKFDASTGVITTTSTLQENWENALVMIDKLRRDSNLDRIDVNKMSELDQVERRLRAEFELENVMSTEWSVKTRNDLVNKLYQNLLVQIWEKKCWAGVMESDENQDLQEQELRERVLQWLSTITGSRKCLVIMDAAHVGVSKEDLEADFDWANQMMEMDEDAFA